VSWNILDTADVTEMFDGMAFEGEILCTSPTCLDVIHCNTILIIIIVNCQSFNRQSIQHDRAYIPVDFTRLIVSSLAPLVH
jgi:hypothetical protein